MTADLDAARLDAWAARLLPHLEVMRPQGEGPFPVVVQMHGCGGMRPLQRAYAQAACEVGVAAVVVDSLTPRGVGRRAAQLTVCTGARLRGGERAVDLLAVLRWLDAQPWADPRRVAAAGWSHGGWAVMEALAAAPPGAEAAGTGIGALKLAALVYPYAGALSSTHRRDWGARPRVWACLAGRDAVVGRAGPRRALDRLRADGLDVEVLDLPDATHAFDDSSPDDPRSRWRPDLAALAHAAYAEALAQALFAPASNAR